MPSPVSTNAPPVPSTSRTQESRVYHCPDCDRHFPTKIGLGVHRRRAHVEAANAEINIDRVKKRWTEEEKRIMAREEALATVRGVKFINQHLLEICGSQRTLEAIKGIRRLQQYRELVAAAIEDLRAVPVSASQQEDMMPDNASDSGSSSSFHSATDFSELMEQSAEISPSTPPRTPPSSIASSSPRWSTMYGSIPQAVESLLSVVRGISGWEASYLADIAVKAMEGRDVSQDCRQWVTMVFAPTPPPRRQRQPLVQSRVSRKQQRRREYARVQTLFKKNMSLASKEILDGRIESTVPDIVTMAGYWRPILMQESIPVSRIVNPKHLGSLEYVWHAVTCEETSAVKIQLGSAPGIDGITARQWRAVPASVKALFFNIILSTGGFPSELLESRTVFLPKKAASRTPADFRPISIASVLVRHLHKILAERIREARIVDAKQRCLDDGCAENISVLAALLHDARTNLRELHVSSLDFARAFDSVSHEAILAALEEVGLPPGLIRYVARSYSNSSTTLEVEGSRSELIRVSRGVRQGDPLSTLLFCLVVDQVMNSLPRDVGYEIGDTRVNAIAYADDVILISSTKSGMDLLLKAMEEKAEAQGLALNASKCVALSIVPAGKQKKYKVLSTPQFHLKGGDTLTQLTPSQEWRYLGVDFRPIGPKQAGGTLTSELDRITHAPLKPQQRLKILRCFLLPRLYHRLVLGGTTLGKLRALDGQVRGAIRRWFRLPKDVATAYFHTACRDGGFGIPSFATTVPGLMFDRLSNLVHSSSPAVKAVASSQWVMRRLAWAEKALTRNGESLTSAPRRSRWWANNLYRSTDGYELRECGKSSLSNYWIDAGSYAIPGRDYVQYHHVRVNCLPSRIRTSRGSRRNAMNVECRAGCNTTETTAHIIQGCHRTHGGRVQRHNAVCKVIAAGLRDRGWTVEEEPRIQTTAGIRKPDLVAQKDGRVCVIDSQVVSGQRPLDTTHDEKVSKYRDNVDVIRAVKSWRGIRSDSVDVSTCTLSWRGVWSSKSADYLIGLGLPKRLLVGITTRVLQGSHTNWTRWNQMTRRNVSYQHQARTGVG